MPRPFGFPAAMLISRFFFVPARIRLPGPLGGMRGCAPCLGLCFVQADEDFRRQPFIGGNKIDPCPEQLMLRRLYALVYGNHHSPLLLVTRPARALMIKLVHAKVVCPKFDVSAAAHATSKRPI